MYFDSLLDITVSKPEYYSDITYELQVIPTKEKYQ